MRRLTARATGRERNAVRRSGSALDALAPDGLLDPIGIETVEAVLHAPRTGPSAISVTTDQET